MSHNDTKGYALLCGVEDFASVAALPALAPFQEEVLRFLADLSAALLKDKGNRAYPDVASLAFFCRRASLEQMKGAYGDSLQDRLGRGLAFHIAPSNVPINFAFSLVSALLAGNPSIVKASSRDFIQTRIVCAAMAALLEGEHAPLKPYVNVITYDRSRQDLTERFSALCSLRLVWGGDETVARVRQAPLGPQAFDVTFGDRYSLLALRAEAVLALDGEQRTAMARGFFNDTYLTDQNACTSPRLVYWVVGKNAPAGTLEGAQEAFWSAVHTFAATRYQLPPVVAVDKLDALYRAAVLLPQAERVPMADNLVIRIRSEQLAPQVEAIRAPGGCFVEYGDTSLEALASVVQRKYQTLSYLGFDPKELQAFVLAHGLSGIDRIVPLGKTMDFSLIWDGYDLIYTLSRRVQAI